jgi:hypothetical protein
MPTKPVTKKAVAVKAEVKKPEIKKPEAIKLEVGLESKSGMWVIHGVEGDDFYIKPTKINEKALGIAVLKEDKVKTLFGV